MAIHLQAKLQTCLLPFIEIIVMTTEPTASKKKERNGQVN